MSKVGVGGVVTSVAIAVVLAGGALYYFKGNDSFFSLVSNFGKTPKVEVNEQESLPEERESTKYVPTQDIKRNETIELDDEVLSASTIPTFDVMRVEPSGDAVIAGRSEAGAIVALVSNGMVIGRSLANAQGEFAIVLDTPLKAGNHDILLESHSKSTKEKVQSEQRIAVSVPVDKSSEVLVVLREPNEPTRVLQLPGVNVKESNLLTSSIGETEELAADLPSGEVSKTGNEGDVRVAAVESEAGKIYVAGQSEPNAKLRVYVDDDLVGEAESNKDGKWLLEADKEVSLGTVEVRADRVSDEEGTVEARAQVAFSKAKKSAIILEPVVVAQSSTASGNSGVTSVSEVGSIPSVIIRRGDNLWTISARVYGDGMRYSTIYRANDAQIRNPDLIYPGQVFVLPEGDLNWQQ
ncbi:Ig-like domain-containing protein [Flexibacterium corallicola]|uniref:Ig-like domain-containing protein n=1 Tax=Flexibacterium corallicola TaxID=3037259 RepID=UPI00286F6617|nr:Ig-like domain-containing protein [Pseudovibrio sp. M1P-2-3]